MRSHKKVLVFAIAYLPYLGGAELALKEITDRISDVEFDLITLRFDAKLSRHEHIGRVNVYRVGFTKEGPTTQELLQFPLYLNKVLFPILAFFKALRLHRRQRYDALWAMMSYAGFPAVFFKWCYPRIPFVLTLQEGDSIEHITKRWRIRMVYPLFRAVFTKADVISVISRYLADFARKMGARAPIEVIPNGADLPKFEFRISNFEISELKKKLGIKTGEKVIITVSRLVEKNGVGDLIEAMALLPEPRAKLVIVGTGPLERDLKQKVRNLHLENKVIFRGEVAPDKVSEYLAIADIFVRPSLSEGMGSAFIEAMAAGVPVIATAVGGIVDFLKEGETGLFCNVRDPKSVAQKVKIMLRDNVFRTKLIRNARKLVTEKYDWDIIARDIREKVFHRVL